MKESPAPCPLCSAGSTVLVSSWDLEEELATLQRFLEKRTLDPSFSFRKNFVHRERVEISKCAKCHILFRAPTLPASEVYHRYQCEPYSHEQLTKLNALYTRYYTPYAKRLKHLLPKQPSILEVGAYSGGFLRACNHLGIKNALGIDINYDVNNFLKSGGYNIIGSDIDTIDTSFDTVCIWNCFDQLAEPKEFLCAISSHIKQNGYLVLRFPNGLFYEYFHNLVPTDGSYFASQFETIAAYSSLLGFKYRIGYTVRAIDSLVRRLKLPLRIRWCKQSAPLLLADSMKVRKWALVEEKFYTYIQKIFLSKFSSKLYAPWIDLWLRKNDKTPRH